MGELEGAVADADGRGEVMVVNSADLGGVRLPRRIALHQLGSCLSSQRRQRRTARVVISEPGFGVRASKLVEGGQTGVHLMDRSCSLWRSSSEMVAKGAPWPSLTGVVGAERFFWREWSSSMVCAFTGGVLSSWQMPSLPSRSSPSLVFLKLMLRLVWIGGSLPRGDTTAGTPPLAKLNSAFPPPSIAVLLAL